MRVRPPLSAAPGQSRNRTPATWSVTKVTARPCEAADYCSRSKRTPIMKTLLAGIALAIVMLFAFEAFAMPYCTGGTFKDGYFVCTSIHDNE